MKRRLLGHMKYPEVRASTQSALATSAHLPTSGFTFVDNSQGASVAVAELSKSIHVALEQLELEGDLSEQLRRQLERLDNEAAKYSNSQLSEDAQFEELSCSQDEAHVVSIAWECAAGAYTPSSIDTHEHYILKQVAVVFPSIGGSRKATTFTTVAEEPALNLEQPRNSFIPLLVVSIRGSEGTVDHMVNANSRPRELRLVFGPSHISVEAHSGFLSSAEILEPLISKHLQSAGYGNVKHVLFTGHSAGGAVASLLFLKFLSRSDVEYGSIRFSCITFGSPPVLRSPLALPDFRKYARGGLLLNIINEFDLVARADSPYILSLVNLYRSIHHLPPMQATDPTENDGQRESRATPNMSMDKVDGRLGGSWAIPGALYNHVGKRVVLQLRLTGEAGGRDSEDLQDMVKVKAVVVPGEDYEKLLFCRIAVHSRHCYGERVNMLVGGWLSKAV